MFRLELGLASSLFLVGGLWALPGSWGMAQSNIVPDQSLGAERSRVIPNAGGLPREEIQGGAQRGANLFHSFREFNIEAGRGAFFANPAGVANILSRVTGRNLSDINGTLGVLGNANFFLINPNGILFGPNARLDVGGAFFATTASAVQLGETGLFSATEPQASNLLTIEPSALFFNARNAGGIVNQSQAFGPTGETNLFGFPGGLQVPPDQTLALVGGDVLLDGGNLTAAGGHLELGSVAGAGEVSLSQRGQNWILGYDAIDAFGNIQLQDGAIVDVSGSGGGSVQVQGARFEMRNAFLFADTIGSENGGDIFVRTTEQIILSDGSLLNSVVRGTGSGGDVNLQTGQLTLRDRARITAGTSEEGDGGNLNFETEQLTVRDVAEITSGTSGAGDGGNLNIETRQLTVRDIARITASTNGAGDGGNFNIETRQLTVRDIARITAGTFEPREENGEEGAGDGGNLTIKATDSVEVTGPEESADGQSNSGLFSTTGREGEAGDLTLETRQLSVRDGAQITSGTFGEGDGGNLTIKATEVVELIGTLADRQFSSGLFTQSEGAGGKAGDLNLETGQLLVRDGAQISAATLGEGDGGNLTIKATEVVELIGTSSGGSRFFPSSLITQTDGEGEAGDLTLETGHLSVRDGAQINAGTFGAGDGGNLTIKATDSIEVNGASAANRPPSGLFAATQGTGNAGTIILTAHQISTRSGGQITATTSGGAGGSITINSNILEATEGGRVQTTTSGGNNAGDINLFIQDRLFLSGTDSGVLANTTQGSGGNGGNIFIDPQTVTVQNGARIAVDSLGRGEGGNITLQAGDLTLSNNAAISAATASTTGGDIVLEVQDLLLLRDNSQITTTAGNDQAGGDGGNIDIDTALLVAFPLENSDITADAFEGNGGNIQIAAQGVFGTEFRDQPTPLSDITASSTFATDGTVQLDTSLDPTSGLVDLPIQPPQPQQVAQTCTPGGSGAQSEFVYTGRGGLPPAPQQVLNQPEIETDWVGLAPHTNRENQSQSQPKNIPENQAPTPSLLSPELSSDALSLSKTSERGLSDDALSLSKTTERRLSGDALSLSKGVKQRLSDDALSLSKTTERRLSGDALSLSKTTERRLSGDALSLSKGVEAKPLAINKQTPATPQIVEAQGWVSTDDGKVLLTSSTTTPPYHLSQKVCPSR